MGGEHELQTDIMRFLAILALCLMAVFALVQSLPSAPAPPAPSAPQPADPAQAESAKRMAQRVADLKAEHRSLEQSLAAGRRAESQAAAQLRQTRADLQTAETRLARAEARLAELNAAGQAEARALRELERRKAAEAAQLGHLQRRLDAVPTQRTAPEPSHRAQPEEPKTAAPPTARVGPVTPDSEDVDAPAVPANPPENDGFSLRFASEQALRQLLSSATVTFYARHEGTFWRFDVGGGRDRFERAPTPRFLYRMTAATVPDSFRLALMRGSGSRPAADTLWGVTLPPAIQSEVRTLMQHHRGGQLVIDANGEVVRQGVSRS